MTHIHTEPQQHDFAASAYIVRTDGPEPRILLHRHRVLGKMMQFGGHVELLENPWQAVAREISEEAGYNFEEIAVLQPKDRIAKLPGRNLLFPQPLCIMSEIYGSTDINHFHDDITWAFAAKAAPEHAVAYGESDEMVLLTRDELFALPKGEVFPELLTIAAHVFDTCLPHWEVVPTTTFQLTW